MNQELTSLDLHYLVNEFQASGVHAANWNATDDNNKKVSSGVYFYVLSITRQTIQEKIVLVK